MNTAPSDDEPVKDVQLFAAVFDQGSMDHRIANAVIQHWCSRLHPDCEVHGYALTQGQQVEPKVAWSVYKTVFVLAAIGFGPDVNSVAIGGADVPVACCRLLWNLYADGPVAGRDYGRFLRFEVKEPRLLSIFGDPKNDNQLWLMHGLNSLGKDQFDLLCSTQFEGGNDAEEMLQDVIVAGKVIFGYQMKLDAAIAQKTCCDAVWRGTRFCAINHPRATADSFQSVLKQRHDAMLSWFWNGSACQVTLWNAHHKPDLNLTAIIKSAGISPIGRNSFTCDLPTLHTILSK